MKPKYNCFVRSASLAASFVIALSQGAQAATFTWDANGGTSGQTDGGGSWSNAAGSLWWNGATNSIWSNTGPNDAIFGNFNGAAGTVTIDTAITVGNLTFNPASSGKYTLSGATNGAANTLTLSGAAPTITTNQSATISALISSTNGFVKEGLGSLTVTGIVADGTVNAIGGTITVNAGQLVFDGGTNTFGGDGAFQGNLTLANFGRFSHSGSNTIGNTAQITVGADAFALLNSSDSIGAFAGSGRVSFAGTLILTSGTQNFTGVLSGGGSLNINNAGLSQTLSGANLFTGTTTATAGTLTLNNVSALQNSTLSKGAGTVTFAVAGTNTYNLGGLSGGTALNIGANTISVGGNNANTAYSASIGVTSAAGGLTKVGTGTLTLSGASIYTGVTTVSRGTLELTGAGSLATSGITFNGTSGFTYTGAAAGSTDSVGALTRSAGNGTVTSTYGSSGNVVLTFTSLAARTSGATADFRVTGGTNGTTNKIVLTGATTNAFIDQGTFFGGNNFAWYDTGSFVRAINYDGVEGVTTAGGGTLASTAHQETTAAVTAQDNATFTTLKITGANAITLGAAKTVTVNGILKTGATAAISGGSGIRAASGQDLVVRTDISTDALSINTPILANGTNALVKSGAGSLTLGSLAVNTYTGGTFVNQGTLIVNQDNNLGSTAGANNIRLDGGTLQPSASFALNVNHGIDVNAGGGTINGNGFQLTLGSANMLSGSGPLTISGSSATNSVLNTGATQDYSGPMTISSGRIVLNAANITNPYGTGDITVGSSGSVYVNNSGSVWANRFFISSAGGESRGAIRAQNGGTFNGDIILTNNATISSDGGGAVTTLNGNISGAFTLTLNGTGSSSATSKVILTGNNVHSATTVARGITNIDHDIALGAYNGTVTINGESTLQAGAADIVLNPDRGVSLSGGSTSQTHTIDTQAFNMTIQGVITGAATETLQKLGSGTLTLTGANTYTGATAINAGTLTLGLGSVGSNVLAPTSTLTLGGGTLSLTGTGTQTVNGLTTTANTSSKIVLSANETLTLGALTSAGANSGLNFNTSAGGANATTPTVGTSLVVLTGQTAGAAINPGFTVSDLGGFGLATVNASNQVIRLTGATLLPASGATSGIDYHVDNNLGGAAAAGSSTLAVTASEAARSITVDTSASSGILTLNSGVVLSNNTWNFGGTSATNTYQVTGNTGGAGLQSVASGDSISFNNYNTGTVTIASPILANGTNAVSVSGTGTTIFSGANTYTGTTTVNGGTLVFSNSSQTSGTLNVAAGAVLELRNATAFSSASVVTLSGGGTVRINGATTFGTAAHVIALGSGALVDVQANNLNGGANANKVYTNNLADLNVASSATFGTSNVNVRFDALSGSGTIDNSSGSTGGSFTFGVDNGSGTFNGVLASSNANKFTFTKIGTGTQTLAGLNTTTGDITVNGGTLAINNWATPASNNTGALTVQGTGAVLNIATSLTMAATKSFSVGTGSLGSVTGTVNHTAGTVIMKSQDASGGNMLLINGGGVYNLNGGTLQSGFALAAKNRGVMIGVNTDNGSAAFPNTFNLQNGTLDLNTNNAILQVGRTDGGASTTFNLYNQTGGAATVDTVTIGGRSGTSSSVTSTFNVTGGTFLADNFTYLANGTSDNVTMLLGTTAQVTLPSFGSTGGRNGTATANITFDFTTGYLAPSAASATYMPDGTFNNAYLSANGAKFNVGFDITIGQLLSNKAGELGTLTKSGAGTLTLSNANTYTGLTTISGGTLVAAHVNALTTSSAVNISSTIGAGTLRLATDTSVGAYVIGSSSNNQGTIISDRATAGAGITHILGAAALGNNTYNIQAGSNVTSGTAGVSFASLNLTAGSPGSLVLNPTTANLTIVGAVNIGFNNHAKTLNLGGTSAGNAINGLISNGLNTLSLTKSDTSTWTLSGLSATASSNYTGTTTIDRGTLAFTTTNPSLTGGLTFGAAAGSANTGTLDLSSASATFGGAFLVQTDSESANTLTIGTGRTLQLNGAVTVGYNSAATSTTKLTATGLGTLSIGTSGTPTNANVQIGNGATSNISNGAILDMSGLTTFYANLGSGTFRVGGTSNGGGGGQVGSTLILADDSTVTATTIIADSPDGGVTQAIKLGSGSNEFNANTITIHGTGRGTSTLSFNTGTGTFQVRDLAGSGRAAMNVAYGAAATGGGVVGTVTLTGHSSDLLLSSLNIAGRTGANTGNSTGSFIFDTGTLDVTSVLLGERNAASGTSAGTLTIAGGTASIGSIAMGDPDTAGGTANGVLTLTGGIVTLAGNITRIGGAGTSSAIINLQGASLDMGGFNIGGANTVTLNAESGTLKNVLQINSGTTGLTKTTVGTLILDGTNSYTGGTTISAGTLQIASGSSLGSVNGTLTVNTGTGSALDLNGNDLGVGNFTGTGGTIINNASGTNKTLTIGNNNGTGGNYAGSIANNTAGTGTIALIKTGTGTLILSGSNSYSGATTVSNGVLNIQSATALGTTAGGTVVNGTNTGTATNARLELQGGITVTGEALTINGVGNFTGALNSKSGSNEWAGNVTIGSSGTRIGAQNGAILKVSGVIDSGVVSTGLVVRNDTTGTVILSGANTYLGDTTFLFGKLQLDGGNNRLPVATKMIMGNAANVTEFDLNGRNQEIAGLSLAGGVTATAVSVNNSSGTSSTLTINTAAASPSSFSGILKGNLGLVKKGADTQTLGGANTYTGATAINEGTLALGAAGSIDNTSGVELGGGTFDVSAKVGGYTVNNLTGSGNVVGGLTVSTTLAIGNSPGEISFANNLTLDSASTFNYEFTGGDVTADLGLVSGDLTLTAGASLNLFRLGTYTLGDTFTLFAYDNALAGIFAGLNEGDTATDNLGGFWRINYEETTAGANFTGSAATNFASTATSPKFVNITAIPEPDAAALLGAFGTLILLRRRRSA